MGKFLLIIIMPLVKTAEVCSMQSNASAFAVATRANIFILNPHANSKAEVSITVVITKLSLTLGTHVSKSNFYVCMPTRLKPT